MRRRNPLRASRLGSAWGMARRPDGADWRRRACELPDDGPGRLHGDGGRVRAGRKSAQQHYGGGGSRSLCRKATAAGELGASTGCIRKAMASRRAFVFPLPRATPLCGNTARGCSSAGSRRSLRRRSWGQPTRRWGRYVTSRGEPRVGPCCGKHPRLLGALAQRQPRGQFRCHAPVARAISFSAMGHGRLSSKADGTAGLSPAPEMPCVPRQLTLVP